MPTVSRRARLLDLGVLGCILSGAALCLVANGRLTEISKLSYKHPGPPTESALAAADRARYLSYGGIALIVVGCVIGAAGAVRLSRRKNALTALVVIACALRAATASAQSAGGHISAGVRHHRRVDGNAGSACHRARLLSSHGAEGSRRR